MSLFEVNSFTFITINNSKYTFLIRMVENLKDQHMGQCSFLYMHPEGRKLAGILFTYYIILIIMFSSCKSH